MNILHIMKDYKPASGGSVVRNGNMISSYQKASPEDRIFLLDLDGDRFEAHSVEDGVEVYRCKGLRDLIATAKRLMKTEKIDFVMTHNFRFLFAGFAARLLSFRFVPIGVELHAIYRMSRAKEWLSYFLLRRVKLVSVLSESAKRYLVEHHRLRAERIAVLRNGKEERRVQVAPSELRDRILEKQKETCVVAYTGSFIDWQGVGFVASSFDRLAEACPDFFLLMLGDGPEFEKVKTKIESSRFCHRALIHPGVDKATLAGVLEGVDVVLIPREKNLCTNTAVPLKAIEAMQDGKCILSSDDDGLTELLHEENAVIFRHYDTESLCEGLKTVTSDPQKRATLGQRAREDAEKALAPWETNGVLLAESIQRLVKKK